MMLLKFSEPTAIHSANMHICKKSVLPSNKAENVRFAVSVLQSAMVEASNTL